MKRTIALALLGSVLAGCATDDADLGRETIRRANLTLPLFKPSYIHLRKRLLVLPLTVRGGALEPSSRRPELRPGPAPTWFAAAVVATAIDANGREILRVRVPDPLLERAQNRESGRMFSRPVKDGEVEISIPYDDRIADVELRWPRRSARFAVRTPVAAKSTGAGR